MSDIMTVAETAAYLHLHPETLREKARRGESPAAKIGRTWRFSKAQLLQWLERGGERTGAGAVWQCRQQP